MNAMVVTTPATQVLLEAGPLQSSLTATSGARACNHAADECQYEYTIEALMPDGSTLPSWLVYTQPTLVATPVLAEHIGNWIVQLRQVRISDKVTSVYNAADITVGCEILTWTPPTMPTQTQATYTVFDGEMTITLAPEYAQQPPCAYTADFIYRWTIPSGAPIYQTSNPYALLVNSQNTANEGIHTVFLDTTIQYGGKTWNERVSYDITIVNPCTTAEIYKTNTTFAEVIEYNIGDATAVHTFTGVSDTVSNNSTNTATTCGGFVYTLVSNDTAVGTQFIKVVDLLNAKGLQIYTESETIAGNYTLTLTAALKE